MLKTRYDVDQKCPLFFSLRFFVGIISKSLKVVVYHRFGSPQREKVFAPIIFISFILQDLSASYSKYLNLKHDVQYCGLIKQLYMKCQQTVSCFYIEQTQTKMDIRLDVTDHMCNINSEKPCLFLSARLLFPNHLLLIIVCVQMQQKHHEQTLLLTFHLLKKSQLQ